MRKSFIVIFLIFFVVPSGCAFIARQRQQEAMLQAQQIMRECMQKRLAGELQGYVASARCSQDRARRIIAESGYPYMDLIDLQFAYDMAVAERIDKGELSEAEGKLLMAELRTRTNAEVQRRQLAAYNAYSQRLQTLQRLQALAPSTQSANITCHVINNDPVSTITCH